MILLQCTLFELYICFFLFLILIPGVCYVYVRGISFPISFQLSLFIIERKSGLKNKAKTLKGIGVLLYSDRYVGRIDRVLLTPDNLQSTLLAKIIHKLKSRQLANVPIEGKFDFVDSLDKKIIF